MIKPIVTILLVSCFCLTEAISKDIYKKNDKGKSEKCE